MKTVDIIIPVYNEEDTIESVLEVISNTDFYGLEKNIIIVDDCSSDSTREILQKYESKYKIIYKQENGGKGSAVSLGIKNSSGDIVLIQDADLEYDPRDYSKLLKLIIEENADVVYGSRFMNNPKENFMKRSYVANKFLTILTNILYNTRLTDMETCYKAIRRDYAKKLNIKSRRFDLEPEITAKLVKAGAKIRETAISYNARNYSKGKKVTYKDGMMAIYALIKYRFVN